MRQEGETILNHRHQWIALAGLLLLAVVLTLILYALDRRFLRLLAGDVNPLPVMAVVLLVGGLLLWLFMRRGWFVMLGEDLAKGLGWASILALVFGVVIVLVDRQAVYPAEINMTWPNAWLYYPLIGFTAQVVFHLVPLAMVLLLLTSSRIGMSFDGAILPSLLVAAVLEPVFQTLFGLSDPIPIWAKAYVAVHILLINLSQLFIFQRYGFIPSYAMRLIYYLIWHVLWGHFRLDLLF
jgi:hypothetical protein